MEAIEFWKYYNCIGSIKSSELLQEFNAASFPHMKKEKRKEMFNTVKRSIDKVLEVSEKGLASYEDTIDKLRGLMSGRR